MVAVTGATGFIGTALCAALLRQGYRVRALVRSPDRARDLERRGVELVPGDLHAPDALRTLVTGAAAVVHGAGAVRGNCREDFDHTNVAGTANLLAALAAAPPSARFLLLSSLAAREPGLSWYAASKRAGEALLERLPELDWIVLRPPPVYGPGDREMLAVFRAMARGIAPVPGDVDARTSLVHVDDLVAALIACLNTPATRQRTFDACDGRPGGYDWRQMADQVAAVWGRPVRLWRVPHWLLDAAAQLNLRIARLSGRAAMLTPPKLRELRHRDWVVDNRAITAVTGWTPQTGLAEGLADLRKAEL